MTRDFVFQLLEKKCEEHNTSAFIKNDPVCIPHLFVKKQDIEIAGFFAATLAWGNRKSIISSATRLMKLMDDAPHDFIINHLENDLKRFLDFKHRTFNATDLLYFIEFFKEYYSRNDSLEDAFLGKKEERLAQFHQLFFSLDEAPQRTRKHVATSIRGSSCKRLNMFLRWMVRQDKKGVDFGLWRKINPADLLIPLDLHVDRVARKLGLIKRRQTDWQTVLELTENLKAFDPKDPVKYDFALFGMGVLDKYNFDM